MVTPVKGISLYSNFKKEVLNAIDRRFQSLKTIYAIKAFYIKLISQKSNVFCNEYNHFSVPVQHGIIGTPPLKTPYIIKPPIVHAELFFESELLLKRILVSRLTFSQGSPFYGILKIWWLPIVLGFLKYFVHIFTRSSNVAFLGLESCFLSMFM